MKDFPARLVSDTITSLLPQFEEEAVDPNALLLRSRDGQTITVICFADGKAHNTGSDAPSVYIKCDLSNGKTWVEEWFSEGSIRPFAEKIRENLS